MSKRSSSKDLDNEIGFFIKNRPYIWVEGRTWSECKRLYFLYLTDRVYIHSRQNFPEGQRTIMFKDYMYIPDVITRDYSKISLLNVWNPTSGEGNALGQCGVPMNFFNPYVPQRDNDRIPTDVFDIRVEGKKLNIDYRSNLKRAEAFNAVNGLNRNNKYFDTFAITTAYLMTLSITPQFTKYELVPPKWYKYDIKNIGVRNTLRQLRETRPNVSDSVIMSEIVGLRDDKYIPLIDYMIDNDESLLFIAVSASIASNNVSVMQNLLVTYNFPPFLVGIAQQQAKDLNRQAIYSMLIREYPE